jgi:hypothetical protein
MAKQFAETNAFPAKVGPANVDALRFEHQLNGFGQDTVVLNQQNAHANSPPLTRSDLEY